MCDIRHYDTGGYFGFFVEFELMKALRRILKYVWPQWHRIVVIVFTAVVVGMLFAVSVGTVLPLLKVMMLEEGLHGWVDRSISKHRHGVEFYLPDKIDMENPGTRYRLRVTWVEDDGVADKAGLKEGDLVVGAGTELIQEKGEQRILSNELLDGLELASTEFAATNKPFYAGFVQSAISFIPRQVSRENSKRSVILIIVIVTIVTALRCTARFFQDYTVKKVVHTSVAHLRQDMFGHSLEIPAGFFAEHGSSDTVSRLVRDTKASGEGLNILFGKALREPLKAVGTIVLAMSINLPLTLIFLGAAPASLYAIGNLGRKIKRVSHKTLRSWSRMLGKLQEVLGAVKVVKVYNCQGYERNGFDAINRRLLKQQFKFAKLDAMTGPLLETLSMIAGAVGLIIGAQWVYENKMEPSEFFTFLIALGITAESLRKTSGLWNKLQKSNAAAERIYNVIDQSRETENPQAIELKPLKEKLVFTDVSFSYAGSDEAALKHVNLTVKAGQNIAIVGPNGSGKTTLANLIPRLYDPDSGKILIDGVDIRKASLFSLRSQIGMVTQNIVTFNDTIAANIGYGKPEATQKEIVSAAQRAFAHEFIDLLPEGYETVIGEQGAGLSGGQLQRIVIARAILRNPSILIFDEATSQVDPDSEAKIHKAIEEIMRNLTSIIIAHRFSTVVTAHSIVVMDNGRIVAQGRHRDLIESCAIYQGLYDRQLVKSDA